jgi:hypothetical protein
MRQSISILFTTLLLSAVISPFAAQSQTNRVAPTSLNPYVVNPHPVTQVSPFNLAYLAYQGYLRDQGIPRAGALINELVSGRVTAQDIMQAAVKANRLSEDTLNDRGYRSALEGQLQEFTTD